MYCNLVRRRSDPLTLTVGSGLGSTGLPLKSDRDWKMFSLRQCQNIRAGVPGDWLSTSVACWTLYGYILQSFLRVCGRSYLVCNCLNDENIPSVKRSLKEWIPFLCHTWNIASGWHRLNEWFATKRARRKPECHTKCFLRPNIKWVWDNWIVCSVWVCSGH